MKGPFKPSIFITFGKKKVRYSLVVGVFFMFKNILYEQYNSLRPTPGQGLNLITCDICCSIGNADGISY